MIDWHLVDLAIHTWLDRVLPDEIADEQIVWADQNIDQPAYPFITLKKDGLEFVQGSSSESRTLEEAGDFFIQVRNLLEFRLTIRTHTDDRCNGVNAFSLLSAILETLDLPSARNTLCDAGLVVIEHSPVLDISSTTNTKWTSRATTEIRFRVGAASHEAIEYFTSVVIDGECNGETQSFTVPEGP
jgi:hypothetical protein